MDTLLFNQARSLQAKGEFNHAADLYQQLLKKHPSHLASRYNLARLWAEQGQWQLAITEFEQILNTEPSCTPACYNLAICWQAEQQDQKAMDYLKKTLGLDPQHGLAMQALGSLLLKQEKYAEAKAYLLSALEQSGHHADIYFNLGIAFLNEGDKMSSLFYFTELAKKYPHTIEAHYNTGVIYQQEGNDPAALRAYAEVLKLNPQHFASLYNTGVILQHQGNYPLALHHYKKAYEIDPHHSSLPFLISALEQNSPQAAPTQYVESLFDGYADHYDRHIQQQLQYEVPKKLYQLFCSHMQKAWSNIEIPEQSFTLIDLGCGTGLAGLYFKPLCHTMVGIDLSAGMLRQASKKQLYSTLNQQDNIEYLKKLHHEADIIIAADVLGYYGDLEALFSSAKNALRPGGCWLFSIETYLGSDPFHLQENARFSHQVDYIKVLAESHGFKLLAEEPATLRLQQEKPVAGFLYLIVSI